MFAGTTDPHLLFLPIDSDILDHTAGLIQVTDYLRIRHSETPVVIRLLDSEYLKPLPAK